MKTFFFTLTLATAPFFTSPAGAGSAASSRYVGIWTETHNGARNLTLEASNEGKLEDLNRNGIWDREVDGSLTPWATNTNELGLGVVVHRVDADQKYNIELSVAEGVESVYFEWFKTEGVTKEEATRWHGASVRIKDGESVDWRPYRGGVLRVSLKAKDHDPDNAYPADCWVRVGDRKNKVYHSKHLKPEQLDNQWHVLSIPISDIEESVPLNDINIISIKGYDIHCWIDDLHIDLQP